MPAWASITRGTLTGELLKVTWMMFWRMKLTPMAVIRGARRGAFRSGRYAKRSMRTPTRPITVIVNANITMSMIASLGGSSIAPLTPSVDSSHSVTNEPTMKTSPWAKLISSMMP